MSDQRAPLAADLGPTRPADVRGLLRAMAEGAGDPSAALAEWARRAGITDPAQMAELSRRVGLGGSVADAPRVPQHICFLLGDVECALPAEAVQSVERIAEVAAVPNTQPWVVGVVQVWGAIVSVVDLRRFFDLPPRPPSAQSRLLVVSRREMTIGLVVDAVTEMRALGDQAERPVDERRTPPWALPVARASVALDGRVVTVLDPERLLWSERMQHYRADAS